MDSKYLLVSSRYYSVIVVRRINVLFLDVSLSNTAYCVLHTLSSSLIGKTRFFWSLSGYVICLLAHTAIPSPNLMHLDAISSHLNAQSFCRRDLSRSEDHPSSRWNPSSQSLVS